MSLYHYADIKPSPSTDGEYQASSATHNIADAEDEADIMRSVSDAGETVYELGKDELPSEVKDIRGRIHNEPGRVFAAVRDDGWVSYFGLRTAE